jgi:thiol-disulfide isomerase/thioredoxin
MVQGGETNENYLYLKMKSEDRYPVQEYRADHKREPFFLSPDYENPRIVEFYAHWCPHCIQFKPQYIKFARKIMEVTEDLLHKTPIEVFAISCVPYNKVCLNHNVKGYPTVQLFMPHSSNGTIIERNKLHPLTVLRRFGISATDYKESPQQEDLQVAFPDHEIRKNIGPHFMHRSSKQVYDDAHLSLDFALRNSVFVTNSALEIQRQSILKDFLLILQKTFPTTDCKFVFPAQRPVLSKNPYTNLCLMQPFNLWWMNC